MVERIQWWRGYNGGEDTMVERIQWWRGYNGGEDTMVERIEVWKVAVTSQESSELG
jgi:hypothetical protein